jgi:hypothetical protein
MPESEEMEEVPLVIIGACQLEDGTKGVSMRFINDDGSLGDFFAVPRSKMKLGWPGRIIMVPVNKEHTKMQTSKARMRGGTAGVWQNEDDIANWKLAEEILLTRERQLRMTALGKAQVIKDVMKGMEPLQRMYMVSDRMGRRIIEALVLEQLRKGTADD